MAERRFGKPYIYVTWLAKLLGGQQCRWRVWFQAHFKHQKYEEEAVNLVQWNRDHYQLVRERRKELEADGWTVTVEDQNSFKLEGQAALVAGKPDIVATKPGYVLVVDGKTGRERDADIWQVFIYLFAVPKARPDLQGQFIGEVQYKRGDSITLSPTDLTEQRMDDIVGLIRVVDGDTPPEKVPSRDECRRCNIGPKDCPERIGPREERTTLVGDF